ncbi:regulatory helix-turn-helix protein, lysR family [Lentzea albidocapillata subsp. violacea]|uniref:Regulatory helix-turn-helix protein, lysR family n=1 Tax=Lentzea albidocapillata subsp. violacea TaxID=128104 RepID=A0A1G9Z6A6_9PSEU|nr:TniQ family protein [Lentzea albidocapillata]SDM26310.1 regulatory helix-turn-helix protein, lysR family [Lentzea albidocapillata subsp. violacea]SDN09185.1 regulatory helix-turn-helix protein, lysR family [Lentzea albidocapillata subsp. violacea]SDN16770.1 regulatory helix-turn-helix protein, lysR family [Lentzea albidocapillata subsp. violacea]
MNRPRTLPIRLAPLPGEALDSWLEALAERLHTNVFDLFRFAGVTTRWNTARSRKPWVRHLDADQLTAVSIATGVPADTLAALTLDRYSGTGLIIDRPARAGSRPRWWRGLRGSRFCPKCLSDNGNRWMLSWRLAWSFACTRHHTLLLDACPACGRRHVRTRAQPAGSPYLGDLGLALLEHSPHGGPPACTYPLSEADAVPLDADSPVLRAQRHVNTTIAALLAARRTPAALAALAAPQQILDDLHAAARAALAALRTPAIPPQSIAAIIRDLVADHGFSDNAHDDDAAHVAVGATAADLMLATGSTTPDPVITGWLAHTPTGGSKAHLSRLLDQWNNASPGLQSSLLTCIGPRLNPAHQLRYGIATSTPRRPRSGHGTARAASVPSLFWRGWALRLNPQGLFDPLPYRQALSMLLQIAGLGDVDYTTARTLLQLPAASNAVCPHFTKTLREAGAWEPVLAVLGQLARALDDQPAPIDYGRRRRWRRICAATLDSTAWRATCAQICHRSSERQERFARLHLIELLTGSHPYHYPQPLTLSPELDGEHYTAFVFHLPAQLSTHLHQQAQTLLRRLHIDEPVTWEPPFDHTGTVSWPGPHPDDVLPQQLWDLVQTGLTRNEIAARLHTTPEHIHLAAVRHPQPRTPRHQPAPGTNSPPTALPNEHDLRAYVSQGLRPGQIAKLTGHNHQRINELLTSNGIGPPTPREVLRTVNPAWLREQYEDNHRSFADIAADLGIPAANLARHARELGLAIRHGVAAHKHILSAHGGPDAFSVTIWTVFATRGAEQRVRRLLATAGHPNLDHAARHLGTRKAVLRHQIDQLEHAIGAALLETTPDSGGIRLTPAGANFAQDAVPVLTILDRSGNSDRATTRRTAEEMPRH